MAAYFVPRRTLGLEKRPAALARRSPLAAAACLCMLTGLLIAGVLTADADERVATIPDSDFERLAAAIKPQPGESPWREIAWLTNVTEARQKAAAEGKPIVIFTAADGSPLSRT